MTILVGDSIGLSMTDNLQDSPCKVVINAEVGRQFSTGVDIVRDYKQNRELHKRMVIELGTNGPISIESLDEMVGLLGPNKLIWFCTNFADRPWVAWNNVKLRAAALAYENVKLIRWKALAKKHPEFFGPDGVHPNAAGQAAYAQLICEAIA